MTKLLIGLCLAVFAGLAVAEPILIVAFGASNTYGKNLSREDAYPAQLERMLKADGFDVVVKNEGSNGDTTADELSRLNRAVPAGARIVIFYPGGNDNRQGRRQKFSATPDSKENIQAAVKSLLDRKILVLFSGNAASRSYVEDLRIPTVGSISQMAPGNLQADGIHLTAEGCRIAAQRLLPAVEKLLKQIPATGS
jgi:acyl-CoA thioesterase-1